MIQCLFSFKNTVLKRSSFLSALNRVIGNRNNFDRTNSVYGVYHRILRKVLLVKPGIIMVLSKVIVGYLAQNKYISFDQITNIFMYQGILSYEPVSL